MIHTNLGRAPLSAEALEAMRQVGAGYSNLELDLHTGQRGSRHDHLGTALREATGAEAGVATNNTAAGLTLTLAALAAGREVLLSRGELVEIGGGFRVPEILKGSGALLREVGTTNRTRVADYAAAISSRTAAILRVHPSNFRMEGFTERPALADLAEVARRFSVPLIEDQGLAGSASTCFHLRPSHWRHGPSWRASRPCATACVTAPTSWPSAATSCSADRRRDWSSAGPHSSLSCGSIP